MSESVPMSIRRVLIVDDEPRMRDMLTRAVSELGYAPIAVRSAEQAMREVETQVPSIILLDINLPGMDGLAFLRELRQLTQETQVVILTGFGSLDAAKVAFRHDVVDFLTKPCSLSELERALGRAEQRWRDVLPLPHVLDIQPDPPLAPGASPATLDEIERIHILAALERNNQNRATTAAELGISERTLYYRLARYQRR